MAHFECMCSRESRKKFNHPKFQFTEWRCPEAGLEHLVWESKLKMDDESSFTPQAIAAQEKLRLYNWWKFIRPVRANPFDASGWSAHCHNKSFDELFDADETEEHQNNVDQMLVIMRNMEEAYDNEDEQAMIDLIKIRTSLWT